MLVPPQQGTPLKPYLYVVKDSIGSLLAQDNEKGVEQVVYCLSQALTKVDQQYMSIKKLYMALYCACTKLRYYTLPILVYTSCPIHKIKYMLSRPIVHGRIGKSMLT